MEETYVPCHQIIISRGDKVIVKGDLDTWVEKAKGMKWKYDKNQERKLYYGRCQCKVIKLSPELMLSMMYFYNDRKYDPKII